jgi:hypothetical protein
MEAEKEEERTNPMKVRIIRINMLWRLF